MVGGAHWLLLQQRSELLLGLELLLVRGQFLELGGEGVGRVTAPKEGGRHVDVLPAIEERSSAYC